MSRHAAALQAFGSDMSLAHVADAFAFAVREAEVEGRDPSSDAAVMLLGSQVAFMTHADVATGSMLSTLIGSCEERDEALFEIQPERH